MNAKERRELAAELKAQGFVYRDLGSWPAKSTYYKPTGEALPGLPAEPVSMMRYLKRGLLLYKPTEAQIATYIFGKHPELLSLLSVEQPVATQPMPSGNGEKCPICGLEFKWLGGHMKAHNSHKKKGKSNKR